MEDICHAEIKKVKIHVLYFTCSELICCKGWVKRKWKFKANGCRRVNKITYSGVLLVENVAQLQKPKLCSWSQIIGIEICWHWMLNLSLGFQFSLPIYLFKLWFSCWELEKNRIREKPGICKECLVELSNCVCWNFTILIWKNWF